MCDRDYLPCQMRHVRKKGESQVARRHPAGPPRRGVRSWRNLQGPVHWPPVPTTPYAALALGRMRPPAPRGLTKPAERASAVCCAQFVLRPPMGPCSPSSVILRLRSRPRRRCDRSCILRTPGSGASHLAPSWADNCAHLPPPAPAGACWCGAITHRRRRQRAAVLRP